MSSDPLANFSCLDELVQVIYQSIHKFVVLSTVSQDEWHVHLGLAGSEGRWWLGSWKEEDIHRIFVCICSLSSALSALAHRSLLTTLGRNIVG